MPQSDSGAQPLSGRTRPCTTQIQGSSPSAVAPGPAPCTLWGPAPRQSHGALPHSDSRAQPARTGHTGLGGDGDSSPGSGRSILQGQSGGSTDLEPVTPARGGRGVQPTWWLGYPSWPTGRHHPSRTGHTSLGGTRSPAHVVVGYPSWPMGRHHPSRTGHTGLRGTRSQAQLVVRVSFMANEEASFFLNRAHRPEGDGESSPGGGRGILHGPGGGIILQEPGTPALGGRGVQPRWWSGYPSWPMGRHYPSRTEHTGLEGTGSPAQVVVGVSFTAHGEASPVRNRATNGRATTLRRVPCLRTPRPVAMHRACARAEAPHIPDVFPPGPSVPAHLDACHEYPALEPPRFRAQVQAFTRPAAEVRKSAFQLL